MNWISVTDRLPETDSENGIMVIVHDIPKNGPRMYGSVVMSVFYNGKFHFDFKKGIIMNVTHWMPLPLPPEQRR